MTTEAPTAWRNRIVGHGTEAPDQLLANRMNFRIHPKAQQEHLAAVLDQVGLVQSVIVNQRTGYVVDGHLRVELAISRGEESIPVVYVDLDEDEERLVLATFDPISAMAVPDREMLAELLVTVQSEDAGIDALLDAIAMQNRVTLPVPDGLTDPDAVPEPPAEPITKPGDLWLLGEHRVLCGDSTEAGCMARLCGESAPRCMWTDPPYGVEYVGKTAEALTIRNDDSAGLPSLLRAAFVSAGEVLVGGSPFYVARPAGVLGAVFLASLIDIGWGFHQELQWVKDTMVLGHSDYHLRHETIVYGWTPGRGRSGRGRAETSRWFGDHSQTSVFDIARPKRSDEHPTAKPVALVEAHLRNSTAPDDAVLDPFLGSGTTLIAAERLGRRCYGMEIEPKYVDVIVSRWEAFTGRKAELASSQN